MMRFMCLMMVAVMTVFSVGCQSSNCRCEKSITEEKVIKIGQVDLTFHHLAASVVTSYFDRIGQKYELVIAPHVELYRKYRDGEVDMIVGAWLPSSHGTYIEPVKDDTEFLSVIYKPYCFWGVPSYVPEDVVSSVSDLKKPEVSRRFVKRIQGINEGAGISRFSRKIIEDYGLDKEGFFFENGTIPKFADTFTELYKKGEWTVLPIWEPQFLLHSCKIRKIEEPRGHLGTVDSATIIVRKKAMSLLSEKAISFLRNLKIGNANLAKMDYQFAIEKRTSKEIADEFLNTHGEYK